MADGAGGWASQRSESYAMLNCKATFPPGNEEQRSDLLRYGFLGTNQSDPSGSNMGQETQTFGVMGKTDLETQLETNRVRGKLCTGWNATSLHLILPSDGGAALEKRFGKVAEMGQGLVPSSCMNNPHLTLGFKMRSPLPCSNF